MKIAIMGSGGLGGLYGGRLAHSGCDVWFVARGAHHDAMQQNGLRIESDAYGSLHLPDVNVTDDPATIGPVDYVLFAVKLWDTEAAARAIVPLVGDDTAVISLQNGVTKDDVLRRQLGDRALMGGVAYVAARIARPGVVQQTGPLQRLVFGEHDGRRSPRAERLLESAMRAGLQAELSDNIRRAIWEKYVFLVALSGTTATMRSTIGPIREHPQTRAFLLDLMRETVAVGRAHGADLAEGYADDRLAFLDSVPAEMSSSMHHDLENGNRLEVEWLSGGVVQLSRAVNVPTPANRAVRDILALYASGLPRA